VELADGLSVNATAVPNVLVVLPGTVVPSAGDDGLWFQHDQQSQQWFHKQLAASKTQAGTLRKAVGTPFRVL
jgi:hypothetical protein